MDKTIISKMRIKPQTSIILKVKDTLSREQIMIDKNVIFVNSKIADAVIYEVNSLAEFNQQLPKAIKLWNEVSSLWFTYPKSNNKIKHDINRDILWKEARKNGFDLIANIAITKDYSSVRFKKL
jgi:hypothetical protein